MCILPFRSGPNVLRCCERLCCSVSSHTNYHASYADQTLFSFFAYLPTITHRPTPCEIRFRPGKTAIRNLSMDSAFSCSIPDPIHTPRVVCFGASNSMDRYTRLMVYISGTRLNNLDGDFITTSCTPPSKCLMTVLAGVCLLTYLSASATTFPGA